MKASVISAYGQLLACAMRRQKGWRFIIITQMSLPTHFSSFKMAQVVSLEAERRPIFRPIGFTTMGTAALGEFLV